MVNKNLFQTFNLLPYLSANIRRHTNKSYVNYFNKRKTSFNFQKLRLYHTCCFIHVESFPEK